MIIIPATTWDRLFDEFGRDPREVEQVCYLDGVVVGTVGVVTTITIPNAQLSEGRFQVLAVEMSKAGGHLRRHQLVRLAQVHTHPTEWVGHSAWDDMHAYSQLVGAVSIVLPVFGRTRCTLMDAGVHLRSAAGWRQVPVYELSDLARVVPALVDLRPAPDGGLATNEQRVQPTQRRSWWKALAFWRNA